jgi:hypothetical protein
MGSKHLARHAALVVAGAILFAGTGSTAAAQRAHPRPALGPRPVPPAPTVPYPGATVTIDPSWYRAQRLLNSRHGHQSSVAPYYPIYESYPYAGSPGGVYDTNGRPLYTAPEPQQQPQGQEYAYAGSTPDLSGSPYVVIEGGTMIVDFGNGDRRAVPSCAAVEQASTPEGKPRTIFYRPPAYALVLRQGQRGQVLGRPAAGARVCYTNDTYGRTVLAY